MSKSKGNIVYADDLVEKYGKDAPIKVGEYVKSITDALK